MSGCSALPSDDTLTVTIGGEEVPVPKIMNFAVLKRVWPAIRARDALSTVKVARPEGGTMFVHEDPIDAQTLAIRIISGALIHTRPDLTPEEIEKRLLIDFRSGMSEAMGIDNAIHQLLVASGLIIEKKTAPAESAPTSDPDPSSSTETSTAS